jgi:hypothetical protein
MSRERGDADATVLRSFPCGRAAVMDGDRLTMPLSTDRRSDAPAIERWEGEPVTRVLSRNTCEAAKPGVLAIWDALDAYAVALSERHPSRPG